MNSEPNIPEVDAEIPRTAVSIYGSHDASDDFPVLKAFQQYIDSEHTKARKRMIALSALFSVLMITVICVFLYLLLNANSRNQTLNDRLVEYAMNERERAAIRPPQDNSAILALSTKVEEMHRKLVESQARYEKLSAEAAEQAKLAAQEAAKPKGPTPEEIEIKQLKALLSAEQEKLKAEQEKLSAEKEKLAAAERERQRQAELEEYRRKHYPECYGEKPKKKNLKREMEEADQEIEDILNDSGAIRYFDSEEDDEEVEVAPKKSKRSKKRVEKKQPAPAPEPAVDRYTIPVDIKGSSSNWSIPLD